MKSRFPGTVYRTVDDVYITYGEVTSGRAVICKIKTSNIITCSSRSYTCIFYCTFIESNIIDDRICPISHEDKAKTIRIICINVTEYQIAYLFWSRYYIDMIPALGCNWQIMHIYTWDVWRFSYDRNRGIDHIPVHGSWNHQMVNFSVVDILNIYTGTE